MRRPGFGSSALSGLLVALLGAFAPAPAPADTAAKPRADVTGPVAVVAPLPPDADAEPAVELRAVSCGAAATCVAVGSYHVAGLQSGLVEQLTPNGWTAISLPRPRGAKQNAQVVLQDVSCVTPTFCAAVGAFVNGHSRDLPLGATWDGVRWTVQPIRLPADARAWEGYPYVSCGAADSCVAVSAYRTRADALTPLLLTLTDGSWTSAPGPTTGASYNELYDIDCASAVDCVAVGDASGDGRTDPLVLDRSAAGWTATTLPIPGSAAHPGHGQLQAVSCASATFCRAVGSFFRDGVRRGLIEGFDGSHWVASADPPVAGDDGGYQGLLSVSCGRPARCLASGNHLANGSNSTTAMLAVLRGDRASPRPVVSPSGEEYADVEAVACSARGPCLGVGAAGVGGLLVHVSGVTVSTEYSPSIPAATQEILVSADLDTTRTAVAVGDVGTDRGFQGILVTGIAVS